MFNEKNHFKELVLCQGDTDRIFTKFFRSKTKLKKPLKTYFIETCYTNLTQDNVVYYVLTLFKDTEEDLFSDISTVLQFVTVF